MRLSRNRTGIKCHDCFAGFHSRRSLRRHQREIDGRIGRVRQQLVDPILVRAHKNMLSGWRKRL